MTRSRPSLPDFAKRTQKLGEVLCQNEPNEVHGALPISNEPNPSPTDLLLESQSRQDEANPGWWSAGKNEANPANLVEI
jgi:hypothetical protein